MDGLDLIIINASERLPNPKPQPQPQLPTSSQTPTHSQNLKDAANWLAYTYLYVRMLRSPEQVG